MKKVFLLVLLVGNTFFSTAFSRDNPSVFYVSFGMGHTTFQDAYSSDGDNFIGRLAMGIRPLHLFHNHLNFGLELGVQNGNRMRLGLSEALLEQLDAPFVQTSVKPMVDLLATIQLFVSNRFFAFAKGGGVYRRWQIDRNTTSNLSRFDGELQAGLGVLVFEKTKLIVCYQGIYGGGLNTRVVGLPNNAKFYVDNIPTQHGLLLGLELDL